jgi:hypothetical protein
MLNSFQYSEEYNITESYSGVLKSMKLDLVKSDIVELKSQ